MCFFYLRITSLTGPSAHSHPSHESRMQHASNLSATVTNRDVSTKCSQCILPAWGYGRPSRASTIIHENIPRHLAHCSQHASASWRGFHGFDSIARDLRQDAPGNAVLMTPKSRLRVRNTLRSHLGERPPHLHNIENRMIDEWLGSEPTTRGHLFERGRPGNS